MQVRMQHPRPRRPDLNPCPARSKQHEELREGRDFHAGVTLRAHTATLKSSSFKDTQE